MGVPALEKSSHQVEHGEENDTLSHIGEMKTEFKGRTLFLRETSKPISEGSLVFSERPLLQISWAQDKDLHRQVRKMKLFKNHSSYFAALTGLASCDAFQRSQLENCCAPSLEAEEA